MIKFVAIDVETANADMSSICSIGAALYEYKTLITEWYTLIDPRDYFDEMNVSIHGISKSMVKGAPTFKGASRKLGELLDGAVVVTHTHFDRVAIQQACANWTIPEPNCTWLDSARVARRAWPECAASGYGLANVCNLIGYGFAHHHALEDAKAAAHILIAAMEITGLDLEGWLARVRRPINPTSGSTEVIRRDANPEGSLYGEVLVFTGALTIPRREAADLAAAAGCQVIPHVTSKTTLLVVGDTDVGRLAGHQKSTKHRKAEELIGRGLPIRIIRETDFRELVAQA